MEHPSNDWSHCGIFYLCESWREEIGMEDTQVFHYIHVTCHMYSLPYLWFDCRSFVSESCTNADWIIILIEEDFTKGGNKLTWKRFWQWNYFMLFHFISCLSSHQTTYLLPSYNNWIGIGCVFIVYLLNTINNKPYTVRIIAFFSFRVSVWNRIFFEEKKEEEKNIMNSAMNRHT